MTKVLFILKQRPVGPYGSWSHSIDGKPLPSGLSVSASQVADMLTANGIETHLVQVVDNNSIDREVSTYKPTHVIIEAFWVIPSKFEVLKKLHPSVVWIIRNHSKIEFLAFESGMIGWAIDYVKHGLILACNSDKAVADFKALIPGSDDRIFNLSNYYATPTLNSICRIKFRALLRKFGLCKKRKAPQLLKIGCFGAIRPLKNHLNQAVAAISAANKLGTQLKFYVNSDRKEGERAPAILTSMVELFNRSTHELIQLPWSSHEDFLKIVKSMDIVMQVSSSETFNIVAADAVSMGVPVVASFEIPWLFEGTTDPNNIDEITKTLIRTWQNSHNGLQMSQLLGLQQYVNSVEQVWLKFFKN